MNTARILRYEEQIEQPNSEATNQRASQPTNPLFNVATIINHLGYLYFCISLWDSRHIQAIGAKFSSLSIYTRRFYNAAGAAAVYPIPPPPPFPQPGRVHLDFHEFHERSTTGRQHHHPSRCRVPANLHFRARFNRPFDPLVLAELLQLRVAQQDSSSSESESRCRFFATFNFFFFFFFFWKGGVFDKSVGSFNTFSFFLSFVTTR